MQLENGESLIINAKNGRVVIAVDEKGDVWIYADKKLLVQG